MDIAAINTIVSHMQQRSFYEVLKAMFDNHFIELPPARWFLEVDGTQVGRAVFSHRLVLDDVLGEASETWGWAESGKARLVHLSARKTGALLVTVDGKDASQPRLKFDTNEGGDAGLFLVLHIMYKIDDKDHEFIFSGLME